MIPEIIFGIGMILMLSVMGIIIGGGVTTYGVSGTYINLLPFSFGVIGIVMMILGIILIGIFELSPEERH